MTDFDKKGMTMDQKGQEEVKLLYFGVGSTVFLQQHVHPFYQLELCLSGKLCCHGTDSDFLLQKGDMWLIPPENPHRFSESRDVCEYLSLKFIYNGAVPAFRGSDRVLHYYMERIAELLCSNFSISPYSDAGRRILENHLRGIMSHLSSNGGQIRQENDFIAVCRDLVCKHGYHVNVSFLAEHFHYTRSQLQYRFAKEYHAHTNIKYFIEEILLDLAKKHLQYSSMNISAIASAMNFPSLYAFSRFFKRKAGVSPLKIKSRMRAAGQKKI